MPRSSRTVWVAGVTVVLWAVLGGRRMLGAAAFAVGFAISVVGGATVLSFALGRWLQNARARSKLGEAPQRTLGLRAALAPRSAEPQPEWSREWLLHPRIDGRVAVAVDRVLGNIIRDFVLKWYQDLVPEPYSHRSDSYSDASFPRAVEAAIRVALSTFLLRLERLDFASLVIGHVLPLVTQHLEAFRIAEAELRGTQGELNAGGEEMDLLVARKHAAVLARLRGSGRTGLHPAVDVPTLNSQITEQSHLRKLFDQILPLLLPPDLAESKVVHIIVREIVACAVMTPVVEMLSDPDFYNRLVEEKAGAALREQKMVERFREALEKQSAAAQPTATEAAVSHPSHVGNISPSSTLKDFERFSRSVSRCSTLFDARRMRNDIDTEIRKTEVTLAEQNHHDPSASTEALSISAVSGSDLRLFLDRLHQVRECADRRIAELGGASGPNLSTYAATGSVTAQKPRDILLNILNDRESQALSYLTEFLDRRNRVGLLQFWLAVEGLKDPLEDLSAPGPAASASAEAAVKEDLRSIADVYFRSSTSIVASSLDPDEVEPLRAALARLDDANEQTSAIRDVRRRLFAMQTASFDRLLAQDFPAFASSDLYLKATASLKSTRPAPAPVTSGVTPASPGSSRQALPRGLSSPQIASRPSIPAKSPSSSGDITRPRSPLTGQHALWRPGATRRTTAAAAPQISLQAAFDERPPGQRLTGDQKPLATLRGARTTTSSASLDFLMSGASEDRSPLFGDEDDCELSRPSTRHVSAELHDLGDEGVTSALHEALSSIISTADGSSPRITPTSRMSSASLSDSEAFSRPSTVRIEPDAMRKATPPTPLRKGLFDDDEADDSGAEDARGLSELIEPISPAVKVNTVADADAKKLHLESQLALLDGLMRKAELTGNRPEIRLLTKSIDAVTDELNQVTFRRSQLEMRESRGVHAKLVPGRTKVSISGTSIGRSDAGGTQFVLYLVEVHQLADDGAFASGWIVTRRYSEFASLNATLRERYPISRNLDFPAKTLGTGTNSLLVEQRKVALDKYLKALIRIPVLCQSTELSAFLSRSNITLPVPDVLAGIRRQLEALPGHSLVRSFYTSLTAGLSAPSLVEALIGGLRQQAAEFASLGDSASHPDDVLSSSMHGEKIWPTDDALASLPSTMKPIDGELVTSFTAPICNLVVEVFELNDKNQWLRKQGIVIVLQQILGSAIERKLRDAISEHLSNDHILQIVTAFENALWPGGILKPPSVPRTAEQKARSRDASYRQLMLLMPDLAASFLGRTNARRGARRLFAVCQNQRLNRHLAYCVIDEFIRAVFPEVKL